MIPSRMARSAVWSLLALPALAPTASAQAPGPRENYLPDSTVLLRVDDRVVRANEFVESFFEAWPEYRPMADSLGRVQLLNQFVNKEILGAVARKANPPLQYEERQKLREYTQRTISNTLFQRMVRDSVIVTDADVAALKREYSSEKHLQQIVFADPATAKRIREELAGGKIAWKDAFRRYNISKQVGTDGDMGWVKREAVADQAPILFDVAPGQFSQIAWGPDGYHLTRVLERRDTTPPPHAMYPHILRREISVARTADRMERIQSKIRDRIGLVFVDSNLVWVSSRFPKPRAPFDTVTGAIHLRTTGILPSFAHEDTGRVLARWNGGQFSLDQMLDYYRQTNAFVRVPVNTPALLRAYVQNLVLEPYRTELGIEFGLDKDPMAVLLIEGKREQMLVEHLYQDSIMSKVRITPAERRKYYDSHVGQFLTYATAQYAVLSTGTQARADSIAELVRKGHSITAIMREDSIRFGHSVGFVKKMTSEEKGSLYFHPVMEELKPGQVSIENIPDVGYTIVQLQSFDPGRQLSYQEAEKYVDESLQNMAAERMLNALIARHRKTMRVETHPELVMKIYWVDPLDRENS